MIRADQVARGRGLVEPSACARLRHLAAQVPADQAIVELGAHQGLSTGWLLLGAQEGYGAHVTTVDPWEQRTDRWAGWSPTFAGARAAFDAHMHRVGADATRLTVRQGLAAEVAAAWPAGRRVGLLFHDASHDATELRGDLAAWLSHLAGAAVIAVHDAGNPDYGIPAAVTAVLDAAWWYEAADGTLHREPAVIPWRERPVQRGLLIARRTA